MLRNLLIPQTLGPHKNYSGCRFSLLTGNGTCKILVGCRLWVVGTPKHLLFSWCWNCQDHSRSSANAHVQAFIFFTARTLSRSRSVARRAHFQAFASKLAHVLDSLIRTAKKRGLWEPPPVLTPVPSQAIHGSPSIAVGSRRVKIVRNLHTCVRRKSTT